MVIQVTTTADKKEILEKIAKDLLEKRLIACAQISGPIKSIYWWKGEIVEDEEFICTMKTKEEVFNHVKERIKELHPYEVPEIVGTKLENTSSDYEMWVEEVTKDARGV